MSRTTNALADGIAAAKAGKKILARLHLENATELEPTNPICWLWLAWTAESPVIAIASLEEVLSRSPDNELAKLGLAWSKAMNDFDPDSDSSSIDRSLLPAVEQTGHSAPVVSADIDIADSSFQLQWPTADVSIPIEAFDCVAESSPEQFGRWNAGVLMDCVVLEDSLDLVQEDPRVDEFRQSDELALVSQLSEASEVQEEATEIQTDVVDQAEEICEFGDIEESPEVEATQGEDVADEVASTGSEAPQDLCDEVTESEDDSIVSEDSPEESSTPQRAAAAVENVRTGLIESSSVEAIDEETGVEEDITISESSESSEESCDFDDTSEEPEDHRPLVLAIDDSPTVRKLVSRTLEKHGYRVVTAEDGMNALELIGSIRPQLILLDINMPRLDGYQLCKLIKNHQRTLLIPVVMLTGNDGVFDKLRGKLVGCDGYLTKPFESDDLVRIVSSHVSIPTLQA